LLDLKDSHIHLHITSFSQRLTVEFSLLVKKIWCISELAANLLAIAFCSCIGCLQNL